MFRIGPDDRDGQTDKKLYETVSWAGEGLLLQKPVF